MKYIYILVHEREKKKYIYIYTYTYIYKFITHDFIDILHVYVYNMYEYM